MSEGIMAVYVYKLQHRLNNIAIANKCYKYLCSRKLHDICNYNFAFLLLIFVFKHWGLLYL